MPELNLGQVVTVPGPRGGLYTLTRSFGSGDAYTCTCMYQGSGSRHFRNVPENARTCRHLLDYRGWDIEVDRIRSTGLTTVQFNALLTALPPTFSRRFNQYFYRTNRILVMEPSSARYEFAMNIMKNSKERETEPPAQNAWQRLGNSPLDD